MDAQIALKAIRAAYELKGSERDWIARQRELTAPLFPPGHLGVVAGTWHVQQDSRALRELVDDASAPGLVEKGASLWGLASVEDDEELARTAIADGSVVSFASLPNRAALELQARALGFEDYIGLLVYATPGLRGFVGAFYARAPLLTTQGRALLRHVAGHLAAGFRLRQALIGLDAAAAADAADAALASDGEWLGGHAPDALVGRLRRAVLAREQARQARDLDGLSAWQGLLDGRWTLVDHFESDGRRWVLAYDNRLPEPDRNSLGALERSVVALAMDGRANKSIASELDLDEATVSRRLASALSKLGIQNPRQLPKFAEVARGAAGVRVLELGAERLLAFASDTALKQGLATLTAAELEAVRLALDGRTLREIALLLSKSQNTVRNQLRSAYARFGVGSIRELAARLG